MGTIADIKHNLSIGAPKLRSALMKMHANRTADDILLPVTLVGGTQPAHVKSVVITLWTQLQDHNGHAVYTLHTQTRLDNNGHGWDLAPRQKINLTPVFDLAQPMGHPAACLINMTADIGRNTDNPSVTVDLYLTP